MSYIATQERRSSALSCIRSLIIIYEAISEANPCTLPSGMTNIPTTLLKTSRGEQYPAGMNTWIFRDDQALLPPCLSFLYAYQHGSLDRLLVNRRPCQAKSSIVTSSSGRQGSSSKVCSWRLGPGETGSSSKPATLRASFFDYADAMNDTLDGAE